MLDPAVLEKKLPVSEETKKKWEDEDKWQTILEKDKEKNPHLFLIADHLWWLALMVKISLVMMVLSIIGTILLGF
jgi:hypothetical protein|uniref:Uncharacterized protein n=1 Tax=uncultured marine microorganism HF4000_APKG10F17 TaxID=455558 RepID=B3TC14_9ZZZZ|nr:hypothetical protein ALOHA_HF4000APKG10F17ctg1g23 [uncultured marine microorganism HF4000_APKG10F17]